ncbi:MAG: signal peptidase I [Bacilli bacterium]|nr:signal peptidase I [Bacilli bacterium]
MKIQTKIYMVFFVLYILLYKIFFPFLTDFLKYIVNPLLCLLFCILGYLFLYRKNRHYLRYENDINYRIAIASILYITLFYGAGAIVGYSRNPYLHTMNVLVINLFSILLVTLSKEYIRNLLLNEVLEKKWIYKAFITFIFIINDLNFVLMMSHIGNGSMIIRLFIELICPIIAINIFSTFLCLNDGYFPSMIYRTLLVLPSFLIPIDPKLDEIMVALFQILFPLFAYLSIRYMVRKKNKNNKEILVKPKKWILTFVISLVLLLFALGAFPTKPIVILTGSMKPNILEGDLVIVRKCDIENVKEGDIIEYQMEDYTVIHRIIQINNTNKGITLTMKGDNNEKEDKEVVTKENLVGCYQYKIPYLGYPTYLVHQLFQKEVGVETKD